MNFRTSFASGLIVVISACSAGSSSGATRAESSTKPTAPKPTVSRETVLAVNRCLDAVDPTLAYSRYPDGLPELANADELCSEAGLQADADGVYDLTRAVKELGETVADIRFLVEMTGELEDSSRQRFVQTLEEQELQAERKLALFS